MATTEEVQDPDRSEIENLGHKERAVLKAKLKGLDNGDIAELIDSSRATVYNKLYSLTDKGFLDKKGRNEYSRTDLSQNIPLEITPDDIFREDRNAVLQDALVGAPRSESVEKIDVSGLSNPLQKVTNDRNWLKDNEFIRKRDGTYSYTAGEALVKRLHVIDRANTPGAEDLDIGEDEVRERTLEAVNLVFGEIPGAKIGVLETSENDENGRDWSELLQAIESRRTTNEEIFEELSGELLEEYGEGFRDSEAAQEIQESKRANFYLAEMLGEIGRTSPYIGETAEWQELVSAMEVDRDAADSKESSEQQDSKEDLSIDMFKYAENSGKELIQEFNQVFQALEPGEDEIPWVSNRESYELDMDGLKILFYTLRGDSVGDIEEKTGMPSREIVSLRDDIEPFIEDKGDYTCEYVPSASGMHLIGNLYLNEEFSASDLNPVEEVVDESETEAGVSGTDSVADEVRLMLEKNDKSMEQSRLADELEIPEEEVPEVMREVREEYDVIRRPEDDGYTVELRESDLSWDPGSLTRGSLWQKVRGGHIPGNEIDPERLIHQISRETFQKNRPVADEIFETVREQGGSMEYENLAAELNRPDDKVARALYIAHDLYSVEFGEDELRVYSPEEDQPAWRDFS